MRKRKKGRQDKEDKTGTREGGRGETKEDERET